MSRHTRQGYCRTEGGDNATPPHITPSVRRQGMHRMDRTGFVPSFHSDGRRLALLEFFQNHRAQLRDAARPERQDHLAFLRGMADGVHCFSE